VQTYLERDVRGLRQIGDLTLFKISFERLRFGVASFSILPILDVILEIVLNTVKQWMAILEATFQIIVLQPYFANIGKRLVKTPKVYFTDTGHTVLSYRPERCRTCSLWSSGRSDFETAVLTEIVKSLSTVDRTRISISGERATARRSISLLNMEGN